MVQRNLVPEKCRGPVICFIARINVAHEGPQKLGNLGVAVFAGKYVLAGSKRIDNGAMLKFAEKRQPSSIAGVRVEVGGHFVHATEFRTKHLLNRSLAQSCENTLRPAAELNFYFQGFAFARESIGIARPANNFVSE